MGFKCTSLIFSIWCMTIFLVCFSLQPTLGFICGDFGYNCINQRYYQKCDKEKNTRDIKVISVCPRNTICIQSRPNPCQPSKENTLEQIRLEQDQKLATQSSEEKAAVKQIIKEKMSDSAPLGNQDDSINLKTPSSTGNQGGNEAIEMKNLGSTTPISASTTVDHNASSQGTPAASATPAGPATPTGPATPATPATHPTPHKEIETKVINEKGPVTEHYTAEEHKEGHEKSGEHPEEHKEEGHEKSGEHHAEEHKEEGHGKSGEHHTEEHKEEGHEKSGEHHAEEHKEEGHEKSGEHHAEEHKEDHEKTGEHHGEEHKEEHKEGHEKSEEHHGEEHKEEHKEGHEKSEEHHAEEHKEDHEKTGEHHGVEHKEDHKEEESDSEAEEHVKHDNAKEDEHAEHGDHEEPKKHPEEHTTPASKKEIFGTRNKRGFICPNMGTFPDKASEECFYLCYRNRRSIHDDLKAISVCCPPGMFFNCKTHKCTDNEKKTDKTKLSRLKRRRRWRSRG